MKNLMNLQLMADGGAGTAASGADGGAATGVADNAGVPPVAQEGGDLSNVVYGKSSEQDLANPAKDVGTTNNVKPADKQKLFDAMIRDGGEYQEEFNKRFQDAFNKRFKDHKALEETVKRHDSIMGLLAARYGVDATDAAAIEKAISDDNALIEEAAFKEGLNVDQYRAKLQLEQDNARMKAALEEREQQQGVQQIYAEWLKEADELVAKYGIQNFDMATEMENPQFTQLLSSGIPFEAAYKTIHFDDMLNGAMAVAAQNVSQAMVNNIQSRNRRPAENGTQSASSTIFKADPSKFTNQDLDEIRRRVAAGEEIYL